MERSRPHGFNGSTVGRPWLTWKSTIFRLWTEMLQWVHGRATVVNAGRICPIPQDSARFNGSTVGRPWLTLATIAYGVGPVPLQWVHGRATVVNANCSSAPRGGGTASMGPRSGDRG